ncbi:MAG: hypothetical protein LBC69_02720 [Eubacteriaceae bacterium]|jgi:hypothetical protein|nr:hypothetical protein [Eubacteriaceae bacterium]
MGHFIVAIQFSTDHYIINLSSEAFFEAEKTLIYQAFQRFAYLFPLDSGWRL